MVNALDEIKATTHILLQALRQSDLDKGYEAVSVLLMQGMTLLGPDHPAMQQFFPVWNAIERHISSGDTDKALGQTLVWSRQLDELIEILHEGPRHQA